MMKLSGINEVEDIFDDLADGIEDAAKEALEKTGEKLVELAKHNAPKATGKLRGSIGYKVKNDSVEVFATADHAAAVEYGTEHTAAQPFMRKATHEGEPEEMIENNLSHHIAEVTG